MKTRLLFLSLFSLCLMSGYYVFDHSKGILDLATLFDYERIDNYNRSVFLYNNQNPISDKGATLGRVLFYDKQLSVNGSVACASCHQQEHAFGDSRKVSIGFNGQSTDRHAMRLVNIGFHPDDNKFWDKRVRGLENAVTLPFQNAIEMGFSDTNGFPGMDSLLNKMRQIEYYHPLFKEVFGDTTITEKRMGLALAQFLRSINTFDSRFDEGFAAVGELETATFPNFTEAENRGKKLYFNPSGSIFGGRTTADFLIGAGCGGCHAAPDFGIRTDITNNGVIGVAGDSIAIDLSVHRSPSLKNIFKPDGTPNGPFMHDGSLVTMEEVIAHYTFIPRDPRNDQLAGRLFPDGNGNVEIQLTDQEKLDLIAFLKTLSGPDVYTNEKWSDPFNENGELTLINCATCPEEIIVPEGEESSIPEEPSPTAPVPSLFQNFDWLSALIELDNCKGTSVQVYDQGIYQYVFVRKSETTIMYFQDGSFYCQDAPNFSCKEAYRFGAPSMEWSCNMTGSGLEDFSVDRSSNRRHSMKLNIFPNPSKGTFQVILPVFLTTSAVVELLDPTGKIVFSDKVGKEAIYLPYPVHLPTLSTGVYFLKIRMGQNQFVEKVVIK